MTSSILKTRSMISVATITRTPLVRPMVMAPHAPTASHPAVIPTRPARTPLIVRSGRNKPSNQRPIINDIVPPKPPAIIVLAAMWPISGVPAVVEPALKPSQPTQRITQPRVARTAL